MNATEKSGVVFTWQQLSLEHDAGRRSRLLFRLAALCAPKVNAISVIVDCSDSYDKAIQEIGTLRKAVSRWPADWVVHFFKLSNSDLLATQKIADFCKGEDCVERYLESHLNPIPPQCRGSFLRPCIEAIARQKSTESDPVDQIVIVLGDGQFTDFLPVALPDGTRLVVISSVSNTNGVIFDHMQWGTRSVLNFFNSCIPHFDGEISLVVRGAPAGARFFSVTNGTLQEWGKPGECTVDLRPSANSTFLIDCEPELAMELSWWIRSAGELVRLPAPVAGDFPDVSDIRNAVYTGLQNVKQKQPFHTLFESWTGRANHHEFQAFFSAAEFAAKKRIKWNATEVSSRFAELVRSSGSSQDAYLDAVLVVAAQTQGASGPENLIAIGLNKSIGLRMNQGDRLGRFLVQKSFIMSFDSERRRWRFRVDDQQDSELGATSQQMGLPISCESFDVIVLFSKPERR